MKGPAHGAMVAGTSSSIVTGWTRQRVLRQFDADAEPPELVERIRQRIPLIAAGVGFTGLSTAVAMSFDKLELSILSDIGDSHSMPHRELHSLPYLGGAIGAAHLIRHSSSKFGQWIASNLNLSDRAKDIIELLDSLSEWVINATGFGIFGHFIGDIPTKGHGGTALKLLKPITNHNFCLSWVAHNEPHINKLLSLVGIALTGAAWSFTGAYVLSWQPPEKKITSYLQELNEYDGLKDIAGQILVDLNSKFKEIFQIGKKSIWSLPLFEKSLDEIRNDPNQNWFEIGVNPNHFDIPSLDKDVLIEQNILPTEFSSPLTSKSLYEQEINWPSSNGIPLVDENHGIPIQADKKGGMPLQTDSEDGTVIKQENENGMSLQSDDEDGMAL